MSKDRRRELAPWERRRFQMLLSVLIFIVTFCVLNQLFGR
jgi:hypothetical protein